MNGRILAATLFLLFGDLVLGSRVAASRPWIDMGVKDDFAFDQPGITFELLENSGSGVSLGPDSGGTFGLTNRFLLDTGATSIIAMNDAESELRSNGYVTENTVLEQGVAGFSELDVSAPYIVQLTDDGGGTFSLPSTRIMSGQFPDLFGVNGLVGMPGMVGGVVSLDETVWADIVDIFDILPLDVRFSNSLPTSNGHRYSLPIHARRFDVVGDPPLPTSSPIPVLDMTVGFGGLEATGSFILDTGAAISFISPTIAAQLGLDSNGDGQFGAGDEQNEGTLPIGGIGGTIEAPVFLIDRFSVTTEQGVDLIWRLDSLLSVLIVDIHPDIDGVLGSDLLTSGWVDLDAILGGGQGDPNPGPIETAHFDFRQFFEEGDVGKVVFDLSPSFDVVQPGTIGDYNGNGNVDIADYNLWRDAFGQEGASLAADGNGNGAIDAADYTIWRDHFEAASVPVPGDYNRNGTVDAADYTVWRNSLGAEGSSLAADGNGNGSIDADDYLVWKNHFGAMPAAGAATGSTAGVPEPASGVLLVLGAVGLTLLVRSGASKNCAGSCSS
ncbi:MAG: aspartyl protease family protein [Planctomycetes bacterium]|nr:aspartyl protease family protein [Planctomycetota bacterium]